MDIAEVARRSGIAASALRYYERRGLIASVGPAGTRRRFAPGVLDQLALVALGQAAGLSLDEIQSMLSPRGGAEHQSPAARGQGRRNRHPGQAVARNESRAAARSGLPGAEPRAMPHVPEAAQGGRGGRIGSTPPRRRSTFTEPAPRHPGRFTAAP